MALLGISPKQLQEVQLVAKLPSINFFQVDEDGYEGDDVISEAEQLQDLIRKTENSNNEDILQLAEATALVTADEFMRM